MAYDVQTVLISFERVENCQGHSRLLSFFSLEPVAIRTQLARGQLIGWRSEDVFGLTINHDWHNFETAQRLCPVCCKQVVNTTR